ncbi:uncharacterized protein LOC115885376 [Sitophilus oryzae]|uniref:Uncharacterized protein LOC115885376 n=1 Tax=Sitophilus oryzae TaxID=7048 RepID=A0A6J2Y9F2_SITOR|nr:uncharacterized protein LOC115885376 [Sitophilus oryzae]
MCVANANRKKSSNMRLKSSDGPLQVVHNGNSALLNSPKRINTVQNSNYNQNTQDIGTTFYNDSTNNDTENITKKIQQLTIEDVAALTNGHNDTQELRWCNSNLTTDTDTQDQPQLNFQRQLALSNIANNRININSNLAARLRFRAQNAQNAPPYKDDRMPQSPDDALIDEDDAHQSCSSSVSASPQDEDRTFDPSDSGDSSDEGNDYSRTPIDIRPEKPKSFVNPNYPGFQHLAHTLDFDDETLNNANNNNNEEFQPGDKFDSVNRLDSVENIQKVFHDKSLDIEVADTRPTAPEVDRESPNGSCSTNCDSGSECGANSDDSGETVNEDFNIRLEEKKVFDSVVQSVVNVEIRDEPDKKVNKECDSVIGETTADNVGDVVKSDDENSVDVGGNANAKVDSAFICSVVGDFRKEVEDEIGRMCKTECLKDSYKTDIQEAVEKLQVIPNFKPELASCNIEANINEKTNQNISPCIKHSQVLDDTRLIKSSNQMCTDETDMKDEAKLTDRNTKTESKKELQKMDVDHVIQTSTVSPKLFPISQSNQNLNLRERGTIKNIPSFLPLNQAKVKEALSILSPIENKMADATLSSCRESISKIVVEKPTQAKPASVSSIRKADVDADCRSENANCKLMEVDNGSKKVDLGRRDSNRELEEIEIQIKKIKSDTLCHMDEEVKLRLEANENHMKEDDNVSVVRRNPVKMNPYIKKRRDYNQQFGSLITFPKKEVIKRDPLNRRSVPMAKERKKTTNSESLGGFDVYNIETAMPNIDLEAIECHLRAAREEERRRRTDREEIRRRLAMGAEDDYYTDRPGRKPSLQARLQSGMNLQICFMNETVSDNESPTSDNECPLTNPKQQKTKQNSNVNHALTNVPAPVQRPATLSLHPAPPPQIGAATSETDFFTKQARLQTEARMALAQAKEMARMQMEIERQKQKKSPITEMVRHSLEKVGIPFPEEKRRLSRQILTEMNVAQLQVIVNDLHTQIETLNEQLVKFLMDRDDLHMEQDSMLVDIEDLTRYLGAKEQVLKEQHLTSTPQNNNLLPPPSPAPSSPLAALNSTVRPHLNRIASLVKK